MKVTSRKPKPGETVFGGGTGVLLAAFVKPQPNPKKSPEPTSEPEGGGPAELRFIPWPPRCTRLIRARIRGRVSCS